MLANSISVSVRKAWRRLSSKFGNCSTAPPLVFKIPQVEPLAGEVLDERVRARVVEHAPHLLAQRRGLVELVVDGEREQLVVGDAAPEEERQPRGELDVAQPVDLAGRDVVGGALEAEHELGGRENSAQRHLDAGLEAALLATDGVEIHQRRQLLAVDGVAVRARRERLDDLPRARRFLALVRRPTDEDSSAASACR